MVLLAEQIRLVDHSMMLDGLQHVLFLRRESLEELHAPDEIGHLDWDRGPVHVDSPPIVIQLSVLGQDPTERLAEPVPPPEVDDPPALSGKPSHERFGFREAQSLKAGQVVDLDLAAVDGSAVPGPASRLEVSERIPNSNAETGAEDLPVALDARAVVEQCREQIRSAAALTEDDESPLRIAREKSTGAQVVPRDRGMRREHRPLGSIEQVAEDAQAGRLDRGDVAPESAVTPSGSRGS